MAFLETARDRQSSASPWLQYHLGQSSSYTDFSKKLQKRSRQNGVSVKGDPLKAIGASLKAQRSVTFVPAAKLSGTNAVKSSKPRAGSGNNISYRDYFWLSSGGGSSVTSSRCSTPRSGSLSSSLNGGSASGQQGSAKGNDNTAKAKAIRNRLLGTTRSNFDQVKAQAKSNNYLDKLYPEDTNVQSDVLFLKLGSRSNLDHSSNRYYDDVNGNRTRKAQSARLDRTYQSTETLYSDENDVGNSTPNSYRSESKKAKDVNAVTNEHLFHAKTPIKRTYKRPNPVYPVTREASTDSVEGQRTGRVPPPSPTHGEQETFNLRRHMSMIDLPSSGTLAFQSRTPARSHTSPSFGLDVEVPLINTPAQANHKGNTETGSTTQRNHSPVVVPKHDLHATSFSRISQITDEDYLSDRSARNHEESASSIWTDSVDSNLEDFHGNGFTGSSDESSDKSLAKRSVRFSLENNVHEYEPWQPIEGDIDDL